MANVDGVWAVAINTPIGEQKLDLTVKSEGDTFTGGASGAMGSSEIKEGKVSGDTLSWKMDVTQPMALTLEAEATVDGDNMNGDVKVGPFGKMKLTGTRKA